MSHRVRACLLLFSLASCLTIGGTARAYVLHGTKWPQASLGDPIYLTYSYVNMFDEGIKMPNGDPLPGNLIKSSIEEALGVWASAAPLHFTEVPDDGLGYGTSTQHGDIRFSHTYINGPDDLNLPPSTKAQSYYPSSNVIGGDVMYDHSDFWQESGELHYPDILGATIHELGHSLGLEHSSNPDANMYWIFTRYPGLGTGALHPDDEAGIQAIYGAGSGWVHPLGFVLPEPASVTLLLMAAAGLTLIARSKTRSASRRG